MYQSPLLHSVLLIYSVISLTHHWENSDDCGNAASLSLLQCELKRQWTEQKDVTYKDMTSNIRGSSLSAYAGGNKHFLFYRHLHRCLYIEKHKCLWPTTNTCILSGAVVFTVVLCMLDVRICIRIQLCKVKLNRCNPSLYFQQFVAVALSLLFLVFGLFFYTFVNLKHFS